MKTSRKLAAAAIAGTALVAVLGILAIYGSQSRKEPRILPPAPTAAAPRDGLAQLERHDAPRPLPEAAIFDAEGARVPIAELRGRTILMNFWATWCAPCIEEMPALARLQDELGGEAFTVIAVSEDREGAEAVAPFVAEHGLEGLPIYYDDGMAAARALGVSGLPTTLLIDARGREIARVAGPVAWDSQDALAFIREQMDETAAAGRP